MSLLKHRGETGTGRTGLVSESSQDVLCVSGTVTVRATEKRGGGAFLTRSSSSPTPTLTFSETVREKGSESDA